MTIQTSPGEPAALLSGDHTRLITDLRHTLHRHAELSGAEYKTKAILKDFLREHTDFSVTDRGAWFYAFRGAAAPAAKPPIAFRADMDALPIPETCSLPYASENPAVSHRCGHDGHSAALCGLALSLTGQPLSRDVYLIFQHAEEGRLKRRTLHTMNIGGGPGPGPDVPPVPNDQF